MHMPSCPSSRERVRNEEREGVFEASKAKMFGAMLPFKQR